MHFNKVLKPRHALQVAVGADPAGIDPLAFAGRPTIVSAADFLPVLV